MIFANLAAAVLATVIGARVRGWKIRRMTNNAGAMN